MSKLMELIEAALRAAKDKATAASIWSNSSAERREYCEAYDEARTAVLEAVEKLERDAARYRWLMANCALGIKQFGLGWSLNTRQGVAPDSLKDVSAAIDAAMEATNDN